MRRTRSCAVARALSVALAAVLLASGRAAAQSTTAGAASWNRVAVSRPVIQTSAAAPPRWDIRTASPYLDWGGAIGAAGGLVWGATTSAPGANRAVAILGDTVIGFTAGLVGGLVVYVVRGVSTR